MTPRPIKTFLTLFCALAIPISSAWGAPPTITIWDPGLSPTTGPQQGIFNVLGNVQGATLLRQKVGAHPWHTLNRGADGKRLARSGDFNLEILHADLNAGLNTVTLEATNGNDTPPTVTTTTVTIDHNTAASWPIGLIDLSVDPWSKVAVIDGLWQANPDGLRTLETGYDRLLAVGDDTWPSGLDVMVELTPHGTLGTWAGLGIATGWQGHTESTPGQRPRLGWPLEGLGWVYRKAAPTVSTLRIENHPGGQFADGPPQALVPGQRTSVRLYSEPQAGGQSALKLKWWPAANPEPATWGVETTMPSRAGSVLLVAHRIDATFHTVNVSAVTGPPPPPPPPPATPFETDHFDQTVLGARWRIEDPLADSTVNTTGERAEISVPAGVDHDLWNSNVHAPRILQDVPDEDVIIMAKFSSAPIARYQMQGIVFQQDASHLLRFGLYHDGTDRKVFAGWVAPGSGSVVHVNAVVIGDAPRFLKVARAGASWTYQHSVDGLTWTTAVTFSRAVTVDEIGLYAGNKGSPGPAPAYSAHVERVENRTPAPACPAP